MALVVVMQLARSCRGMSVSAWMGWARQWCAIH
jgi:hypothetical protein